MGRFFRAVRAGVRGAMSATGPGRFAAAGLPVSCTHCRGEEFVRREAQLSSAGMALLDLEWMSPSGTALVCTRCGLIQWFAMEPDRIDP